ncbi:hypothetical protein OG921_24335 [Aldersonia sp. NBC_00410]|uniref:hypothetical protein n=1 Tax=Aldersonia sp. NBC_00410 TaxID=2975954 RepID=UPI00224D894E|nr:hypothetical protein [Aldersonia sp. NBC_00410]MCX5044818.1 hypothetical protein [Aldersonia sp. NBC_00410]MCX5046305.1 hypothetical protein [Aldersonia sp. NBC_00410]
MASEITVYSRDGGWKADVEAWKNNFFFSNTVGTQVTVYRKGGSSIWGGTSWDRAAAREIYIRCIYNGGRAYQEGRWSNQSHAELKQWSVGTVGVTISDNGTVQGDFGSATFSVDSVEGVVSGYFGNGEGFQARVMASSWISDTSIW